MKKIIIATLLLCSVNLLAQVKIADSDIKKISLFNQTDKPTHLVVSWLENNGELVDELYSLILNYNKTVAKEDQMSLIVSIPLNYGAISMFSNEMRPDGEPYADAKQQYAKLQAKYKTKKALPNLQFFNSAETQNPWMQDYGDVLEVELKDGTKKTVLMDTNYDGGNKGAKAVNELAKLLKLPVYNPNNYAPDEYANDGDRGGNLETTHENIMYFGNTISDKLSAKMQKLSGVKPIKLDTQFLIVGHVDEIMSVVPAKNKCGAALVYADPVYAINLAFMGKTGKAAIGNFLPNMKYFLKKSSLSKKAPYTIADFDLAKQVRDEQIVADTEVLNMLKAAVSIKKNVDTVVANSKCLEQVIGLPVVMSSDPEMGDEAFEQTTRNLVPLSSPTNLVALGNTLILKAPLFEEQVVAELSKIPGSKVHIIRANMTAYDRGLGAFHCATQVIRKRK